MNIDLNYNGCHLPSVALPGASREPSAVSSVAEPAPHSAREVNKRGRGPTSRCRVKQTINCCLSSKFHSRRPNLDSTSPSKSKSTDPTFRRFQHATNTSQAGLAIRRYTASWCLPRRCSCASDCWSRALRPSCLRCLLFTPSRPKDVIPIQQQASGCNP